VLAASRELAGAADGKQLSRTIARYGRIDLLCLDELNYLGDRRGAELLFQGSTNASTSARRQCRGSYGGVSGSGCATWTDVAGRSAPKVGEAPGRWLGTGTARAGLSGVVAADNLRAVLDGRCPASGRSLIAVRRPDRLPGLDLTFSAPKSVSLLFALFDDNTGGGGAAGPRRRGRAGDRLSGAGGG
jgi:hypothetical protein